jgi:hypothetical protein
VKVNIEKLIKPLDISDIDFRVQSINKGGYATILAYKDARVDMKRLDEAAGPLGWRREHVNSNHNCIVSLWCDEKKQWISKEDTGTESSAEQKKGLASDSFKRACFNWGIGRELYDYPVIQVKLNSEEFEAQNNKVKATWKLKLKEWMWYSEFRGGQISFLAARDVNAVRFQWGTQQKENQK